MGEKKGFFSRLVSGLTKTRKNIASGLDSIFHGFSKIDDDFYEELEENAQPQPLAAEDGAQYIEEDVPPFYDAMAEEYAAYEEEEAKQQAAASNFLDEFPG